MFICSLKFLIFNKLIEKLVKLLNESSLEQLHVEINKNLENGRLMDVFKVKKTYSTSPLIVRVEHRLFFK